LIEREAAASKAGHGHPLQMAHLVSRSLHLQHGEIQNSPERRILGLTDARYFDPQYQLRRKMIGASTLRHPAANRAERELNAG